MSEATIFASIGLKKLIPALGLKPNTVEYISNKILDQAASGCFSCPFHSEASDHEQGACAGCESKEYETQISKIYKNERNKYGEGEALKENAILTYIHLYFSNPDKNGFVKKIDVDELARILTCSPRTVRNNLLLLNKKGYIALSKTNIPGIFQAFIVDYDTTFKKPSEGGRGFIRISYEFFEQLCKFDNINSIRLSLRSYIDISEQAPKEISEEKSLNEIKQVLPKYVTKASLLEMMKADAFTTIFKVKAKARSAIIALNEQFNQAKLADYIREDCSKKVIALKESINKKARKKRSSLPPLNLNSRDIMDISGIALKYPVEAVLQAVEKFYQEYVKRNIAYSSPGALVRAFTEDIVALT